MKRKAESRQRFRSIKDLYDSTSSARLIDDHVVPRSPSPVLPQAAESEGGAFENLFVEKCPTLSPPREPGIVRAPNQGPDSPSSSYDSDDSSTMSDLSAPLSEEIASRVDQLQTLIGQKAQEIASSRGYGRLMEDDPHMLGQWVHSETTDVETLHTIHVDLLENGEKGESFKDALEALGKQFIVTPESPHERFELLSSLLPYSFTNPSLFMLLTLSLVLLLVHFVRRRKVSTKY